MVGTLAATLGGVAGDLDAGALGLAAARRVGVVADHAPAGTATRFLAKAPPMMPRPMTPTVPLFFLARHSKFSPMKSHATMRRTPISS